MIAAHLQRIWFPISQSGLKGKPVKFRRYPRSCKLCKLFVLQATVLVIDGKATNRE